MDDVVMQFMDTATYSRTTSHRNTNLSVPIGWKRHRHPNGDIYYYNGELRLLTPDDICDPKMLEYVLDAHEDHLKCLDESGSLQQLPDDWELTLTDVTEETAVIGMFSRKEMLAYELIDGGLRPRTSPEYFWSHVAEYPSHHTELPPGSETKFLHALMNAGTSGISSPFSREKIKQIYAYYQHLKALQQQGANTIPAIGWLIGAVMPVEVDKSITEQDLQQMFDCLRL